MWCHTAQQYSSADPIKDIQIVTVFNLNAWSAQYTDHVELEALVTVASIWLA